MFSRLGFLGSLGALSFLRLTVLCLLLTLLWLEAGEQSFGRALKEQAKEKRVFKSAGGSTIIFSTFPIIVSL